MIISWLAEFILTAHALLFSTSLYKITASVVVGAGLSLAAFAGWTHDPSAGDGSPGGLKRHGLPFFLALFAGAVVSLVWGRAPGPTIEAIVIIAGALGWFLAGPQALWTDPDKREQAPPADHGPGGIIFAGAAGALSVMALCEKLMLHHAPRLWMQSPIDLSLAILLLGLSGLPAFRKTGSSCSRPLHRYLYLLLLFAGLSAGASRAIIGAAIISMFIAVEVSWKRKLSVAAVLTALSLPPILSRVAADPLAWNRARIYAGAASLVLEEPIHGWGFGAFDSVSRRSVLPDPLPIRRMRIPTYAHSEPIELIFEIGIPLACAVIAGWLFMLRGLLKNNLRTEASVMTAVSIVALFYFPFHLAFPLFISLYAAARVPARSGVTKTVTSDQVSSASRAIAFALGSLAVIPLIYAVGLYTENSHISPFDTRIALKKGRGFDGIASMIRLEPERPEGFCNKAVYSARSGAGRGAISGFSAAVARAPTETPIRFELVRAYLWQASQEADDTEQQRLRAIASHHLAFIRAVEPLFLAAVLDSGDTMAFNLASLELDRLERVGGETKKHIQTLRRKIDL